MNRLFIRGSLDPCPRPADDYAHAAEFPGDISLIGIQLKTEAEIFLSPHLIIFTEIIKPQ